MTNNKNITEILNNITNKKIKGNLMTRCGISVPHYLLRKTYPLECVPYDEEINKPYILAIKDCGYIYLHENGRVSLNIDEKNPYDIVDFVEEGQETAIEPPTIDDTDIDGVLQEFNFESVHTIMSILGRTYADKDLISLYTPTVEKLMNTANDLLHSATLELIKNWDTETYSFSEAGGFRATAYKTHTKTKNNKHPIGLELIYILEDSQSNIY